MEDYLQTHPPETISVLDDGFVRLVDLMPRYVPTGRTPDFSIIRNARVSTGQGLKTPMEDRRLLRYLYRNQHMSPFESVVLTFHLRLPRFVATHFHRHRTASLNEFSLRYSEINEASFFHPSKVPGSLRQQSQNNRQSSQELSNDEKLLEKVTAVEEKVASLFDDYQELLKLGLGREVARSFLPLSTYTEMYFTMNLRNLLHFFELRCDEHTQKETRDYAMAMYKITKEMLPETVALFEEMTLNSLTLHQEEIKAIAEGTELERVSPAEKREFLEKKHRLNL